MSMTYLTLFITPSIVNDMALDSSEEYLIKFGRNLARLRKLGGFTQRDIEDFGVSRSYYGKVEMGRHAITLDKLFLLSKAFGITVDEFFLDENQRPL
jgi:transcriptional regulator with XRE-family HTH domain